MAARGGLIPSRVIAPPGSDGGRMPPWEVASGRVDITFLILT